MAYVVVVVVADANDTGRWAVDEEKEKEAKEEEEAEEEVVG